MGTDNVQVHTVQLQTSSQTAKTGFSETTNLSQNLDTALADLVTTMNATPILASASRALETFTTHLMSTLECFALGMSVIDQGLAIAATDFASLDASLASAFKALEGQLTYYTGYETTAVMPTIKAPTVVTAQTLTLSTSQSSGFWGSIGSFFSHHWKAIAVGAIIVAGVALTPVSGGLSDGLAAGGVAALSTDAAATAVSQASFALAA